MGSTFASIQTQVNPSQLKTPVETVAAGGSTGACCRGTGAGGVSTAIEGGPGGLEVEWRDPDVEVVVSTSGGMSLTLMLVISTSTARASTSMGASSTSMEASMSNGDGVSTSMRVSTLNVDVLSMSTEVSTLKSVPEAYLKRGSRRVAC